MATEPIPSVPGPPTLTRQGQRATLMLNRPEQHNRLQVDDLLALQRHFAALQADTELQLLVLAARGKSCCSGFDLGALAAGTGQPSNAGPRLFEQTVARPPDSVVVLVAAPLGAVQTTERTLTRQLWLFGPFVFGVSTIVVWLVVRRALRPVDRLRAEVDAVMPKDLSARVSAPPVDDELGRLADTMNALLARIQESSERQTRFVSDASHELRSPLASIRTRLEVGLRRPLDTEWPDLATGVLAENIRMEHLVRDLLYLASADVGSGGAIRLPTSVDLDDVVMQEIDNVRSVARVPIDASGVSAARVCGHRDHLRRVVANLLDNAQRHATSVVTVRVTVEGSEAVVRVHDDGEGIDALDRERVFERFTRLDDARTREGGGSGLGLALVREIVTEHRGMITLEPLSPHGTAAVVRLPL